MKARCGNAAALGTFAPQQWSHALSNQSIQSALGFSGAPNLSFTERAISVLIGFGLMGAAVQPRPNKVLSLVALLGGAGLALRGGTGHCPAKAALGETASAPQITRRA
ncbi:MAG: hypothetical protein NVSMB26_06920 [Beijerinckiaceae bacterium]